MALTKATAIEYRQAWLHSLDRERCDAEEWEGDFDARQREERAAIIGQLDALRALPAAATARDILEALRPWNGNDWTDRLLAEAS